MREDCTMTSPELTQLFPHSESPDLGASPTEFRLASLYRFPESPDKGWWLRANMISTVDGAVTGPDGSSSSINNAADFRVFEVLRALSDVVVVAAGTVRAEGYRNIRTPERLTHLRSRYGMDPHPHLVIVSASGNVPADALTTDADVSVPYVVTTSHGASILPAAFPSENVIILRASGDGEAAGGGADGGIDAEGGGQVRASESTGGSGRIAPEDIVGSLLELGWSRILLEGGPALLGQFVRAGVLDELCLTTSPLLFPSAVGRITTIGGGSAPVGPPSGARLGHLLKGEDSTLLARWELGD